MSEDKTNIEKEIVKTLSDPNALALSSDLLEIGLDSIIDNELIQKIPVLGSLAKIYDLGRSIRDRIFVHKLTSFIAAAGTITDKEKLNFYLKIDSSGDTNIGENVLLAIDKVESLEKSKMIGRLFRHFVLELLEKEEFDKCVFAVLQLFVGDFQYLLWHPKDLQRLSPPVSARIYRQELFDLPLEIIDENGSEFNGKKYVLSPLGTKFVNAVYNKNLVYKSYSGDELSAFHMATTK